MGLTLSLQRVLRLLAGLDVGVLFPLMPSVALRAQSVWLFRGSWVALTHGLITCAGVH